MNIFIFSVIAFVFCTLQVLADIDYTKRAGDMQKSITELYGQFNAMKTNVDTQIRDLKPLDSGLKKRYRITQLQEDLAAKKGKPGIENCTAAFDTALKGVEADHLNVVKTELTNQQKKLGNVISTLKYIESRLSGPALTQEINECNNRVTMVECNLLGNYSRTVFDNQNFQRDHIDELTSPALVQKYTAQYINAPMLERDEQKIIDPVNKCLATVH